MTISFICMFILGVILGLVVQYIINIASSEERARERQLENALNKVWEWHNVGGRVAFPEKDVRDALRRWRSF